MFIKKSLLLVFILSLIISCSSIETDERYKLILIYDNPIHGKVAEIIEDDLSLEDCIPQARIVTEAGFEIYCVAQSLLDENDDKEYNIPQDDGINYFDTIDYGYEMGYSLNI